MSGWRIFLVLASPLLAEIALPQAPDADRLTLRIYNRAEVEAGVLARSKRVSDQVFEQAGVETGWLDCPISPEQMAKNPACSERPPASHVVVNILPGSMSRRYGFRRPVFGFALPTSEGRPGYFVSLFFKRVVDLAHNGGMGTSVEQAQAIILGHMMAHEAGHLLLGKESHSTNGVMRFPWDERTLTQMERGLLRFTADEAGRLRAELRRRLKRER